MSGRPASARQLGHLDRLLRERDHSGHLMPRTLQGLTGTAASELITVLESCPVIPGRSPGVLRTPNGCEAGVYDVGGDVFRLRPNRAGTGLYAEQRTSRGWEYAPHVGRRLLPSERRPDLEHADR